jgi:hypothetical protein
MGENTDQPKHPYPSHYRPGSHWATDEAWAILDRLPVGMLPDEYRFLLGGMIAGALMRARYTDRAAEMMRASDGKLQD